MTHRLAFTYAQSGQTVGHCTCGGFTATLPEPDCITDPALRAVQAYFEEHSR